MSDGKKAAYEDAQEKAFEEAVLKLQKIPYGTILHNLSQAKSNLHRFLQSNPALTKGQFYLIESSITSIQGLLN